MTKRQIEAKQLEAHGTELFRYLSVPHGCLFSIRSDGTKLAQCVGGTWRLVARKKPEISMERWIEGKRKLIAELPSWARECRSLPSMKEIEHWSFDSVAERVSGEECEPDAPATGNLGPSWLIALNLI